VSLNSFTIERFGGLNLRDDPQEIGANGATDLLNVDLDRAGRLRTRDGYAVFNNDVSPSSTGYQAGVFGSQLTSGSIVAARQSAGSIFLDHLIVNGNDFANVGSWVASASAVVTSTAHIGTATTLRMFLASADTTTNYLLKTFDGLVVGSGVGKPMFVATSPRSNRLVQGYYPLAADSPSGANGSKSTVFFSDEGQPSIYTATNFLHLRPGDDEVITGIVTLRDLVIVFKQTVMFVFYGENTDDEGLTEFVYREVTLPTAIPRAPGARDGRYIIVGGDSVYFSTRDGIFQTDGSSFRLISEAIQPLFDANDSGVPAALRLRASTSYGPPSLSWARDTLICYYQNASVGPQYLVWDDTGQWRVWRLPLGVTHFAETPIEVRGTSVDGYGRAIFFAFNDSSSSQNIYRMASDVAADDGGAISWSYTSGYYDLGSPAEKRVRYTDVYGSGTVTAQMLGVGGRSGASTDAGSAVTLGTLPAVVRTRRNSPLRARRFASVLSGSGAARVNQLTHYFAPSERTT
jgi:hypothetical protein